MYPYQQNRTKKRKMKSRKHNTRIQRKQRGGLKHNASVRILMYKTRDKKPKIKIRVQNGPRNNVRDIIFYNTANTENYIGDVLKGFPKSPYKEKVIAIQYEE
jgi:hypothetical protein